MRKASPFLALIAAGCSVFSTSPLKKDCSVIVNTQVIDSSGLKTKTVLTPYTISSINRVVVILIASPSSTVVTTKDILQSNLSNPVVIHYLLPNYIYRLNAVAYKAPGINSSDIISTNDSNPLGEIRDVARSLPEEEPSGKHDSGIRAFFEHTYKSARAV